MFGYYKRFPRTLKHSGFTDKPESTRKYLLDLLLSKSNLIRDFVHGLEIIFGFQPWINFFLLDKSNLVPDKNNVCPGRLGLVYIQVCF